MTFVINHHKYLGYRNHDTKHFNIIYIYKTVENTLETITVILKTIKKNTLKSWKTCKNYQNYIKSTKRKKNQFYTCAEYPQCTECSQCIEFSQCTECL
jgi:predicted transcriptional regulator